MFFSDPFTPFTSSKFNGPLEVINSTLSSFKNILTERTDIHYDISVLIFSFTDLVLFLQMRKEGFLGCKWFTKIAWVSIGKTYVTPKAFQRFRVNIRDIGSRRWTGGSGAN